MSEFTAEMRDRIADASRALGADRKTYKWYVLDCEWMWRMVEKGNDGIELLEVSHYVRLLYADTPAPSNVESSPEEQLAADADYCGGCRTVTNVCSDPPRWQPLPADAPAIAFPPVVEQVVSREEPQRTWPTNARSCGACEHKSKFLFQTPCKSCPANELPSPQRTCETCPVDDAVCDPVLIENRTLHKRVKELEKALEEQRLQADADHAAAQQSAREKQAAYDDCNSMRASRDAAIARATKAERDLASQIESTEAHARRAEKAEQEAERLHRSAESWQADAARYADNAGYHEEKRRAAESRLAVRTGEMDAATKACDAVLRQLKERSDSLRAHASILADARAAVATYGLSGQAHPDAVQALAQSIDSRDQAASLPREGQPAKGCDEFPACDDCDHHNHGPTLSSGCIGCHEGSHYFHTEPLPAATRSVQGWAQQIDLHRFGDGEPVDILIVRRPDEKGDIPVTVTWTPAQDKEPK